MLIGQRIRNIEWEQRTAGQLAYVSDLDLPGTLVGAILRSPYPHAKILSIDTSAAASMPEVAAVITAEAFGGRIYPHTPGFADRHPLATDRVRFLGQEVAAVAATSRAEADAAIAAIRVRYKRLPFLTTIAQALAPKAIRLHERRSGSNVAFRTTRTHGDIDAARAAAERTVSGRYRFNRQTHACMEPNGTLAAWDATLGRLEVWTTTQSPYFVREELAAVLDLPLESVIIREVGVGGGFGARSKITDHEAIAAALSMRAGAPVRVVLDRTEEFATTKCRHDFDVELVTGADADGTLRYRDARMLVDNGAYNHSGPPVIGASISTMASHYHTDAVHIEATLVDTNKHPGGQFRGYGSPQADFAVESAMDELADQLGIDPIDLRVHNAEESGDVTHSGYVLKSANLVECLDAVREASGWDAKRAQGGSGHGIGIAAVMHVSGAHTYPTANQGNADLTVRADGRVEVRFGGSDTGTGQKHLLAQIAGTELGLSIDHIDVVMMDSERTPDDLGAWSTRGTMISGHAVGAAARAAADKLRELAAAKLGVVADQVTLLGGEAIAPGPDGARISVGDLVALAGLPNDEIVVSETIRVNSEQVNIATGVANVSAAYAFAAHAVEVEVDRRTGEVRVEQVTAAHDSGMALNPIAFEGQIVGGIAMGLGAALGEELVYESGRLVNPTYLNYALPRAADMPTIIPIAIERPDPEGPYGAKGIGEISLVPVPPAVANAVAHAIGVRITELPITPDKVLTALRRDAPPRKYHLWRRPDRWWIAFLRWAYPRGVHAVLHRYGTRFARPRPQPVPQRIKPVTTVEDAVTALAATPGAAPLGGGTDLVPLADQGIRRPPVLVDLLPVGGLARIDSAQVGGGLRIGASVTLADLLRDKRSAAYPGLREALSSIATPQIREMATVAGNLCQAKRCWFYRNGFDCYKRGGASCPCYAVTGDSRFYHAVVDGHRCQAVTPSDLATILVALDATLHVTGRGGARTMPIAKLYKGPGETTLAPDDVVTAVELPPPAGRRSHFEKIRLWEGDFAVVSVAADIDVTDGVVTDARIVFGAIAPTPLRVPEVEAVLRGSRLDDATIERAANAWTERAHPLARNEWKVDAACGLLARALETMR